MNMRGHKAHALIELHENLDLRMHVKFVPRTKFGEPLRPFANLNRSALLAALWIALVPLYVSADESLKPITIELPEPFFGGTPLDYMGPNLEKPNYKPRAPFLAPDGTTNVSKGASVSSSAEKPAFGNLAFLVDGDKSHKKSSLLGLPAGLQWIQIDLGQPNALYALVLWHFHQGDRVYFDVRVSVADDADFTKNVRTVFANDHDNSSELGVGPDKEYIEGYKGKLIDLKGVQAHYVRFYSNGNTTDLMNHYVEAELFGKPAE